jgi:hypothetical protein
METRASTKRMPRRRRRRREGRGAIHEIAHGGRQLGAK